MKMITLEDTFKSLQLMRHEITLDEEVRQRAERALRRMFELSQSLAGGDGIGSLCLFPTAGSFRVNVSESFFFSN
jgi:hypothetical protein